jgi:hypothetical protein
MSEKRKSYITMLLKKRGNITAKIELFKAEDFNIKGRCLSHGPAQRYRIRCNGKWFPFKDAKPYNGPVYYTKWEVRDLIWRSFDF